MEVYDIDALLLKQFAHSSIRIEQIFLMNKAGFIILILCRHILIVFTNLRWFHADNLLAQSFVKLNIIEIRCCTECDNGTVFANLCDVLCGADIGGRRMGIACEPQIVVHLKAERPPNAGIFSHSANEQSQMIGQRTAFGCLQILQGIRIKAKL